MSAPRSDPPPEPVVFPPPRKRLWPQRQSSAAGEQSRLLQKYHRGWGQGSSRSRSLREKKEVELKKAAKKMQKDIKKQRKKEQTEFGHMSICSQGSEVI